jgi:hypothetical protein
MAKPRSELKAVMANGEEHTQERGRVPETGHWPSELKAQLG